MRPFSTLPVRGQLEPYTPDSRPGWRYLQCTDTPNELKVLLPPRTATLYARILEIEQDELAQLAREPNHGWEVVRQIRHLKDRLERKCHRMARFTVPQFGAESAFRVVNAPADFRLKELERWLREHDSHHRLTRDVLKGRMASDGTIIPRGSSITSASPGTHSLSLRTPRSGASKRLSIASSSQASTAPTVPEKTPKYVPSFLSPVVEEGTVGTPTPVQTNMNLPDFFIPGTVPYVTANRSPAPPPPPPMPVPEIPPPPRSPQHPLASAQMPLLDPFAAPNTLGVPDASTRPNVVSPDPLPHPYQESSGYVQPPGTLDELSLMDEPHDRAMHPPDMGMPQPVTEMPIPEPAPPPPASESVFTESEVGSTTPGRPGLARRRSSLKQNSRFSLGGAAKVVSWAMDNDWAEHIGTYEKIAYGAELAGEDLNRARLQFEGELVGVRNMRENIALSLERLRLETEQLRLEERALKDHEESMTSSFKKLRDREAAYKDRVQALIEETRRVVLAADNKRDHQVLN